MPDFPTYTRQQSTFPTETVPTPVTNYPTSVAADRAIQESMVIGDPATFAPIMERNLNENVVDQAITSVYTNLKTDAVKDSFDQEIKNAQTEEEMVKIINYYMTSVAKQDVSARTLGLVAYLNSQDPGNYSLDEYEQFQYALLPSDFNLLENSLSEGGYRALQQMVNYEVAHLAQPSAGAVAVEGAKLLLPLQDYGLNRLVEEAGIELDASAIVTGSFRAQLREYLTGLSEADLLATVAKIAGVFRQAEADPLWGKILSDFNMVDFWQNVLNEDVLMGKNPNNTFDTVVSNVATAADALILGRILSLSWAGGKSITAALRNKTPGRVGEVLDRVHTSTAASLREGLVTNPAIRQILGQEEAETVASALPKPPISEGSARVLSERHLTDLYNDSRTLADRISIITRDIRRRILPVARQIDLIQEELKAIENIGSLSLRVSPSELRLLDDNAGYALDAVIGATDQSGFYHLSEAIKGARRLDPTGTKVSLWQIGIDGTLEPVYKDSAALFRALSDEGYKAISALEDAADAAAVSRKGLGTSNEYFIKYEQEYYWNPTDAITLGDNPTLRTGGVRGLFQSLLPNSWRVTPRLSQQANNLWQIDNAFVRNTESSLSTFYKLSGKDQRVVLNTLEWSEDFGRRNGRAPDIHEIFAEFPELTAKQAAGLFSYRNTMDAWEAALNRRLYEDRAARNFVTAHIDDGVDYHGKPLTQVEAKSGERTFFDPIENKAIAATSEDIDALYARGGRLIETDIPVGLPASPTKTFNRIWIDPEQGYSIRKLSPQQMKYTPGYTFRFYEDPYFLVKEYDDGAVVLNGRARSKVSPQDPNYNRIIRSVSSNKEGQDLVGSANRRLASRRARGRKVNYSYKLVPASKMTSQERTAAIMEMLQQEGRMFWDKRNPYPLRNINGNRTRVANPIHALERGVTALARQTATEDWLKSLKQSHRATFGKMLGNDAVYDLGDSKSVLREIKNAHGVTNNPEAVRKLEDAKTIWNWIRMLEGVNSDFFTDLRVWAHKKALALTNRFGSGRVGRTAANLIERGVMNAHPIDATRSFIFKTFLALRPVRQLVLQTAQVAFISPLDPLYVGSGKMFLDALGLRRSLSRFMGLDTGVADSKIAKAAGYAPKDWEALVYNLARTGLLDTVDIHSMAGGVRRLNKVALAESALGDVGTGIKKVGVAAVDFMQRWGFDLGEKNNLTFSYLIAARRYLKKSGAKNFASLSREQWDEIASEAQNLGLGMIRPNNFMYQSGTLSLATQFLSFGHKALLTMLGLNPAVKPMEAFKISTGMFLMYGGSILGMRDWVQEFINKNGGANLSPGTKDIIAGGALDWALNRMFASVIDDWKELDIGGTIAPGPNLSMLYSNMFEGLMEEPLYTTMLGPTATVGSRIMQAVNFSLMLRDGAVNMTPREKFLIGANELIRAGVPSYNDAWTALKASKMETWFTQAGESTDLEPVMNELLVRGLLGVRSREEISRWALLKYQREWEEELKNKVTEHKDFFSRLFNLYESGEYSEEAILNRGYAVRNFMEDIDEEILQPYLKQVFTVGGEESLSARLGQSVAKGQGNEFTADLARSFQSIPEEEREDYKRLVEMLIAERPELRAHFEQELE